MGLGKSVQKFFRASWVVLAVGIMRTNVALASDDDCFTLMEAIQEPISVLNMPEKVTAGSALNVGFSVAIPDWSVLNPWEEIELTTLFKTSIPGSADISFPIQLKSGNEFRPFQGVSRIEIPGNMAGMYRQSTLEILRAKRAGLPIICFPNYPGSQAKMSGFWVENKPENVDIDPPVLSEFQFQSPQAVAGSTVRLVFFAKDKSLLCTRDAETKNMCAGKWHQSFISTNGSSSLYFDAMLEQNGFEQYFFDFKIPLETQPGTYELSQVFVKDIHGNYVESPEANSRPKITVLK